MKQKEQHILTWQKPRFVILLFFILNAIAIAQVNPKIPIYSSAQVKLLDGTSVDLVDVAFYHRYPLESGVYFKGQTRYPLSFFPLNNGIWWDTVPFEKVKKLECTPSSGYWLSAIITLESGDSLSGKLPFEPYPTWLSGHSFYIQGERVVLGAVGNFTMDLANVRSMRRSENKPNSFTVSDKDGKTFTVTNLSLGILENTENESNLNQPYKSYRFAATKAIDIEEFAGDDHIYVIVDGTVISLYFSKVKRLTLSNKAFTVILNDGSEASGLLKSDITHILGRDKMGKIFYASLSSVAQVSMELRSTQ